MSTNMRPYTDKLKPMMFPLRIEEKPKVAIHSFDDILDKKKQQISTTVDRHVKQALKLELKAEMIAIQQAALGGTVDMAFKVDMDSAIKLVTQPNSVPIQQFIEDPMTSAAAVTQAAASAILSSEDTIDDDDDDDDEDKDKNDDDQLTGYGRNFFSSLRALGRSVWDQTRSSMGKIREQYFNQHKNKILTEYDPDQLDSVMSMMTTYNSIVADPSIWKNWQSEDYFSFIVQRREDVKNFSKKIRLFSGRAMDSEFVASPIHVEARTAIKESEVDSAIYLKIISKKFQDFSQIINQSKLTVADQYRAHALQLEIEDYISMEGEIALNEASKKGVRYISSSMSAVDSEIYLGDSLGRVNQWWDEVAENVPNLEVLLPFLLMADTVSNNVKNMDWGNWENSIDSDVSPFISDGSGEFMDGAVEGYRQYVSTHFLDIDKYKGSGVIRLDALLVAFPEKGESYFSDLIEKGVIDKSGKVNDEFDSRQILQELNSEIYSVLQPSFHGELSLDTLDMTPDRRNLLLTTPTGKSVSLFQLMSTLNEGKLVSEKYQKIRDVYNVLFDMQVSMTGLGAYDSAQRLDPKISENPLGQFEMTIYPKGEWVDAALKKENGPVTIQFSSYENALQFFNRTRQLVTVIEPLLGTFEPVVGNVGPGDKSRYYQDGEVLEGKLRFIVDNVGESDKNGLITTESASFGSQIDISYEESFFDTPEWEKVALFLSDHVSQRIVMEIFGKRTANRINKIRHMRQVDDYKVGKEEHQENEYDRIRDDKRRDSKRRGKHKAQLKRSIQAAKKRWLQLKASSKKSKNNKKV
jgi:hypothetical protein